MSKAIAQVRDVARRFGIALREIPGPRFPKHVSQVGTGAGLSIVGRIVYYTTASSIYAETILHEVVHLVTVAPTRITGVPIQVGLDYTPEDLFLLQYERCVAKSMGRRMFENVCGMQQDTPTFLLDAPGVPLYEINNFEALPGWVDGFSMAMRLGLIDDRFKPTWQRPRWNRKDGRMVAEAIAFSHASNNLQAAKAA
jgi:hypothetical protein